MSNFTLNAVHIHILLIHFPIVLSIVSPCILIYGLYRKSREIIHISFFMFIVMAMISIPVFLAWNGAIKTVSALSGIDVRALVLHERIATVTFWLIILLGLLSTVVLSASISDREADHRNRYYAVLIFSFIVIAAVSVTGYYGGNIRHTEIHG